MRGRALSAPLSDLLDKVSPTRKARASLTPRAIPFALASRVGLMSSRKEPVKMTKKRVALLAVLPLTVAVMFGVLVMLPPHPGVTKANFDRIEKGMTAREVEMNFDRIHDRMTTLDEFLGRARDIRHWKAHDGSSAFVEFQDDCVYSKKWINSNESYLDKIRRWLHLN
jgi:hypothetical protein